jgi:hypothetical protein
VGVPTAAHFIYIPFVLMIGIVIGFVLAGRARAADAAEREAREKARAERKAKAAAARKPDDASSRAKETEAK